MAQCNIDDCETTAHSHGWCQKHYKRWKRNGHPLKMGQRPRAPLADRFWAKVLKSDGCWIWGGGTNHDGYGLFSGGPDRKTVVAHRYSWLLTKGEIPSGLHLDHLCRVRNCVRPDHLEPVTPQENARRAWANPDHGSRRRKSHCLNGHPLNEGNVYLSNNGARRSCKTCQNARSKAQREPHRAGVLYQDPWKVAGTPAH